VAYEKEKRHIAENIWLNYFNQELHKKGLISDSERNAMILKIESRKTPGVGARKRTEYSR
jgi:hypothetical protein